MVVAAILFLKRKEVDDAPAFPEAQPGGGLPPAHGPTMYADPAAPSYGPPEPAHAGGEPGFYGVSAPAQYGHQGGGGNVSV